MRIHLTGGVGAGKSTVLRYLEEVCGAQVMRADDIARSLMEPGTEGYRRVVALLGEEILGPDKSIDREQMAKRIYSDKEARAGVNAIIHPMTWDCIERKMAEAGDRISVAEAALPVDSAHRGMFDAVWYVYADPEIRVERLMKSRGYSREKCRSIIASQRSDAEYRKSADAVIDNSGTEEETREQIRRILEKL